MRAFSTAGNVVCIGFVATAVLLVAPNSLPAQQGSESGPSRTVVASQPTPRLQTADDYFGVSLTPVQRERVTAIRDTYTPKLKAVAQKSGKAGRDTTWRIELEALRKARMQEFLAVLTPAQRETTLRVMAARQRTSDSVKATMRVQEITR